MEGDSASELETHFLHLKSIISPSENRTTEPQAILKRIDRGSPVPDTKLILEFEDEPGETFRFIRAQAALSEKNICYLNDLTDLSWDHKLETIARSICMPDPKPSLRLPGFG